MIVGKRDVHHRPNDDLAVDRNRPLLNCVHSEHANLRRVYDRGRKQRAKDAAVSNCERAALEFVDLEFAGTSAF